MSGRFLAQLLLLFLLVYADTVYSKVHYITPSLDGPCAQNSSCLTLSQFAANSSYIETDTSLLFLPGNHTLDRELLLAQVNKFSMTKDGVGNETIFVECSARSGRFHIRETTSVSIHGLHFIGCGSNNVSQVNWLTITSSTFQGVQEGNTVLVLDEVSVATIDRCSFLSNSLHYPIIGSNSFSGDGILAYVYQRSTPSGMLYVAFSNVSIISSKFMHNRADIGGALVAHNSTLYLARSTYSNNTANFGGVMVTSGSTIDMDNNAFINNVAQSAGVMVTYDDTITISSTTFNNNSADRYAGVMITLSDSSFTISNSTFSNNTAGGGGVMSTSDDSSFTISNSTFSSNRAELGGVMITSDDSSFTISNSTFSSNRAELGGVMITSDDSSFTISNSTFSSNRAELGGVMITSDDSSFTISSSTFSNNTAGYEGGVMYTFGNSSFTISNSTFSNNTAGYDGGVMHTFRDSSFTNSNSTFSNNTAGGGGVMSTSDDSSFTISNSTFSSNRAELGGVMITSDDSSFTISNSTFSSNRAELGGVMITSDDSSFTISNSTFSSNRAEFAGVMITSDDSSFTISNSTFSSNRAELGGVMITSDDSSFTISSSTFSNNTAGYEGGVMYTFGNSSFTISNSTFSNNTAGYDGGVMHTSRDSSFTNSNSTFSNNTAGGGGVMSISDDSSFTISNSTFSSNRADGGGVMITSDDSSFTISNSTFSSNRAELGGVMITSDDSSFTISSSTFSNNTAGYDGGVMYTSRDSSFTNSTFSNNTAGYDGGVMHTSRDSSFTISNSTFTNNTARHGGGVMRTDNSSFTISNSTFSSNRADGGGVMITRGDSSFTISNSTFSNNTAGSGGGVMILHGDSFTISTSTFSNNRAEVNGGVMETIGGVMVIYGLRGDSSFTISNSTFSNNRADHGGVMVIIGGFSFTISNSTFSNNTAEKFGGVIFTKGDSSFTISTSVFVNNKATVIGGVFWCTGGTLNVDNSNFSLNAVSSQGGGVIFILQCSTHITNSRFDDNNGSLYTFNSNLTFSGHLTFENSMEPVIAGNGVTSQEGGAITSFQSTVIFTRESVVHVSNNQASDGGALLATESTITVYGETTIANNMANSSGGGISLKQSRLEIKGMCQFVNNVAVTGGGIYASSSTITVFQPGTVQVTNNNADLGGGLYLEVNPKLYTLKNTIVRQVSYLMTFTGNHANYGGALYVSDDTNSGACLPDIECFIQTLALYPAQEDNSLPNTINILFSENTASEQGLNLFGGLLDRCIPSPFAEVYQKQRIHYSGATYLGNISNIDIDNDSISSQPVRVCFCNSEHEPDCSYQPPVIRVQKGKAFNVSLVAVDQADHTVDANITVSLSSSDGGFDEGQQIQSVVRNCTNLTFNVFSPREDEKLNLSPDGPCGSATLSTSHVTIEFIECTCPVGFEPLSNSQSSTKCECVCDSALSPYIIECNITTSSVLRKDTNSWITYINDTDPPEYVIYQNCPFDYCQPQTQSVTINFNLPNGADSQCAYDRTGVLCGACKEDLSLSLASSRCVPCHTHWPAVILLAAAIAGILLVTALLALNMTVSVGLINGFIFYANIVSAGSTIFFPSSEPSFPSVFVAWLNLDIGIDVCFIDGLDVYAKTWLQLAFPLYIISLVVIVIVVSEYSPRFAGLIGKKDPISTLATLILLSYAKLLSITITALSSAVLDYPDGHQETVWLPDGNVPYFKGKHIPLALVAMLIIIIGLPYTILLFLWQWIVRASRWMIFKWTRSTKLNAFIASHHVPHNSKYRYWTGLLLLVRVVLYITASVTVSAKPQTFPLITNTLIGVLIVFKCIRSVRVYKKSFVDLVDTALYLNLLVFSAFSQYDFKTDITKQTAVAHISTIITFILFIGAIVYHVTLLVKKEWPTEDLNEYPLAPVNPANAKVTHSVVEPPKRDDEDPPPADCEDSDEQEITDDCQILTPPDKA